MRIDRVKFAAALARKDLNVKKLSALTGLSRTTITAVKGGKSCTKSTAKALTAILGDGIVENEEDENHD